MRTIIDEVMITDLCTLNDDATVAEAARAMRERDIGDVLVTDPGGALRGIVTDRDVVLRVVAENRDPSSVTLADILSSHPVITIQSGESVSAAIDALRMHAVRRIPVVEGDVPVGIVTLGDLAQRRDPTSVLADISANPPNN